jgi:hypothetical protein
VRALCAARDGACKYLRLAADRVKRQVSEEVWRRKQWIGNGGSWRRQGVQGGKIRG